VFEAVIFDWGGTLTPWHTIDIRAHWLAAVQAVADDLPGRVPEQVAEDLHNAELELWVRCRDEHRSGTFEELCAVADVPVTVALRQAYALAWEPHTITDPDAAPMLGALRERGWKVGLLSNTLWPREHHEQILARDGVLDLFDGAVYTSEIPWTKPHPEAFLAAMAAVGASDPARCVFVGDRLFDDVYGAAAVGMRTVHLPLSTVPAHQLGHSEGEPDGVIHRLADLVPLLDGWAAVTDQETRR
jgi:putative hydrolase of the HAD superfamily